MFIGLLRLIVDWPHEASTNFLLVPVGKSIIEKGALSFINAIAAVLLSLSLRVSWLIKLQKRFLWSAILHCCQVTFNLRSSIASQWIFFVALVPLISSLIRKEFSQMKASSGDGELNATAFLVLLWDHQKFCRQAKWYFHLEEEESLVKLKETLAFRLMSKN